MLLTDCFLSSFHKNISKINPHTNVGSSLLNLIRLAPHLRNLSVFLLTLLGFLAPVSICFLSNRFDSENSAAADGGPRFRVAFLDSSSYKNLFIADDDSDRYWSICFQLSIQTQVGRPVHRKTTRPIYYNIRPKDIHYPYILHSFTILFLPCNESLCLLRHFSFINI